MTTIRELVTKIGFDVDTKPLEGFESAIKGVQRSIVAVGAVAAGFAAGLFSLAKNVSNVGDEIAKSSQELGLSTDAFQEWRYAASQAGISQDELATSVRMFSRNIGNAATSGTGPFVERMQQLGVSLSNANGKLKSNDELLLEVADALTNVKDASVRGAIAQEFFGRSGLRMATFLSAGSNEMKLLRQRARDLGLVLDNDAIKSAEEFNDRLEEVGDVIKAVKNQVGAALIPAIREVVMGFLDWFLVNRKILTQNLQKFVVGLTEVFRVMWDFINKLVTAFNDFAKRVGGTTNAVLALIAAFALVKFSPLIAGLFGLAQGIGAVARAAFAVQGSILLIPIAVILFTTALGMGIQALLEFFSVIDESGKDSMTVWEMLKLSVYAFVGSLGVLVAVKIVGWLSSLAAAAFSATAAFWSMTAPFIVLGLLIGVVAYGLYKLYNLIDDYLGGKLTENIKKAWEGLKDYFVKFFTGLGDWITSKFGGIIDSVVDKMKWVRQQLQKLGFGQNDEEMSQKLTAITENKIAMDDPRMVAARETYFPGQEVKPGGVAYQMLKNVAMQSSRVPTMPGVASSQIVRNGNQITNNSRPVNMNSNVTVNLPASAGTSNQIADITNAVKLAWQEETQRFVENGLFNSAELE